MKTSLLLCFAAFFASGVLAQEPLTRAEAVKFAALLNFELDKLKDTPIPTDADVKRPFGMKAEKRGGLVVPEVKLSAEILAKASKEVQPVGQLWLAGLVPMRDGGAVSKDQLKLVTVQHEGQEVTLPLCVLGVRRAAGGELELLIYGKDKEPLLTLPLTKLGSPSRAPAAPLEFTVEREGDIARIKLVLAGQYEAIFSVTAPAE